MPESNDYSEDRKLFPTLTFPQMATWTDANVELSQYLENFKLMLESHRSGLGLGLGLGLAGLCTVFGGLQSFVNPLFSGDYGELCKVVLCR